MDEIEVQEDEKLYQVWMFYMAKNTPKYFKEYVNCFLQRYQEFIDIDFLHLDEGFTEEGPHLTRLPEGILQIISKDLQQYSDQENLDVTIDVANIVESLTKCLIIICRNLDNIAFVASCEFVAQLVNVTTKVILKMASENIQHVNSLTSLVKHVLHFFECMYDPYLIWRKRLKGWKVDPKRLRLRPAVLHVEIVPFFYECFSGVCLDVDIQIRLLNVFGAIMSGSQHNALQAISPATLDVCMQLLSKRDAQGQTNEQKHDLASLKDHLYKCVVLIVQILSACSPDQRQVEVNHVFDMYVQTILKFAEDQEEGYKKYVLIKMLESVNDMMNCKMKDSLQEVFIESKLSRILVNMLGDCKLGGEDAQTLALTVLDVLMKLMQGKANARKLFKQIVGVTKFVEVLKSLGQPSKQLLKAVLNMAVECEFTWVDNVHHILQNAQATLALVYWLPDIHSYELQNWLSNHLLSLCSDTYHNRMLSCKDSMIGAIINAFHREKQIDSKAIGNLIKLLESLGSYSITATELKLLIHVLQVPDMPYMSPLMHAMGIMARQDGRQAALHYFDFTEAKSGIALPTIKKLPGNGFTFHAWLCLEDARITDDSTVHRFDSHRRMLYSFIGTNGAGFEAFFTMDCTLIIAVITKKDYLTITLTDCALNDQHWHCVDIVQCNARRPFSQSQLSVFIDGKLKLTSQFKYPTVTEPLIKCCIGHTGSSIPGHKGNYEILQYTGATTSKPRATSFKFSLPLPHLSGGSQNSAVNTIPLGNEDSVWGSPISLQGVLGSVCVFHDILHPSHVKALYALGPNHMTVFHLEDAEISELGNRLMIYYNAKAYKDGICVDQSGNHLHGYITGGQCSRTDIKDVINCIGGVQVLFPLLEQVVYIQREEPNMPSPVDKSDNFDDNDDWVVLPSSSQTDSLLDHNPVAAFLTMLRSLIQTSFVNQETLVRVHGMATIGALLQKVDPRLIDVHVLMASQLLVEAVAHCNKPLLYSIYQYLLFDFRIWSRSEFPVKIGHIQYLSTIIKDDRKFFRKKYGVQFMLDIIRTHYSQADSERCRLTKEDLHSIRAALFGLIKYYLAKDIKHDEVKYIMAFVHSVNKEDLMLDMVTFLCGLLENHGNNDQLYLLLFEPDVGETLYSLLVKKSYTAVLREKVLKMISLLLKTDKVYDKSKYRIRLQEVGFSGMISLMQGMQNSSAVLNQLFDLIIGIDLPYALEGALSVIELIPHDAVYLKLEISRKILATLFMKPGAPKLFAKQLGWQESLVNLFIMQLKQMNEPLNLVSLHYANEEDEDLLHVDLADTQYQDDEDDGNEKSFLSEKVRNKMPPSDLTLNTDIDLCTPLAETPQFVNVNFFDFDTLVELGHSHSHSRGSSDSLDDSNSKGQSIPSTPSYAAGDSAVDIVSPTESSKSINSKLKSLGVTLDRTENMEQVEELCQNLLIILFSIMWKGVEGTDELSWKERGYVFSALKLIDEKSVLIKSYDELSRRLFEMLLQACITDLRDCGQAVSGHCQNAMQLVRLVYDFTCMEEKLKINRFSERLIEDIAQLLEVLAVWGGDAEWTEMAQLGFSILLKYAGQDQLSLCAEASARLHMLIQTRPMQRLQEACFILYSLNDSMDEALRQNKENYSFLVPVMKALLEKAHDLLSISAYLPMLPSTTASPTFFDDFKVFSQSAEWHAFITKQVQPSMNQFVSNSFDELQVNLKLLWTECQEQVMITSHKRNREKGESKLRFQSAIMDTVKNIVKQEERRYQSMLTILRNQHLSLMRQWRSTKNFFVSERGVWYDESPCVTHWKLSNQENFIRMRPKLVPNYNFDMHIEASRLRDNLAPTERPDEADLSLLQKAIVQAEDIGDDRLGDEEWSLISSTANNLEDLSGKEKLVLSEECDMVTLVDVVRGRLEVTTTHVYFFDCSTNKEEKAGEDFKWALSQLREIHFRRYNLRRSALEFFLIDQSNYFINFSPKLRNKVYSRIVSLRPPNLFYYGTRSPAELLKASGLTQKWVNREISNFEYLMHLNTIAGRTYNDLSQYPIFPWILADYVSETLNLDDPSVFRDLSKPVGVLNPKNEHDVREKYENFEDPTGTIKKFHYGTHYSSAAGVMHYMLRVEPFTTLHIQLQSDRFDVADRQFHSIPSTWQGIIDNPNDVKELIPEFFYLPEFLQNLNGFDLGVRQLSYERVDAVVLPKWAKSPEDFVSKHRKALESDYVSANLHNWIDLIFGYKQKGEAAVEALNVFYYCTYEGAVDLDAIVDPLERKAVEGMINNFGQTPCQLLKEPHPKRLTIKEKLAKSTKQDKPINVLNCFGQLKAYFVEVQDVGSLAYVCVPRNQVHSFIQAGMPDSMITVSDDGILGIHGWLPYDKSISNYFTFERDPSLLTGSKVRTKNISGPFAPGLKVTPSIFVVSHDAKVVFSGGNWDNSLRIYSLTKNRPIARIIRHTDIITCLNLDYCGKHLITGSRDTTCMIWEIIQQSGFTMGIHTSPIQTLYGHDSEITCVKISIELDLAVSGSKDGTLIIHTVRTGQYMRTLQVPCDPRCNLTIPLLVLSEKGEIGIYCKQSGLQDKLSLHLYSVNGKHLVQEFVQYPLNHMIITGDYLLMGNNQGTLFIRELFSLQTVQTMPLHVPIQCLAVVNNNTHILAGLQDGKLIILGSRRQPEVK
ncbi:neurobeachin-like protein 1 isoform X2 [Tubulanus polymorphus]|uniref:neurobeachin-like protein 1 isoform X2 n=1 Tax=Tubulanus polymorphus TaxID=672921 RepID=UPI003DA6268E